MKHELKKYLFDIKTSIGAERDFSAYQKNKLLRRGVKREIEIIGEAMNQILKLDPDFEIENARQIVDTRNWVIHVYDKVDDVVIWGIVLNNFPKLKKEIEKHLPAE
mgnify:CR=1 FL=1